MKTKIFIILVSALPLFLAGCFAKKDPTKNLRNQDFDIVEIEHDYTEVLDYQILYEKMFEMERENYYVYFYSTTCTNCQEIKNIMIKKALERKDIYFVKSSNQISIKNDVENTIGAEKVGDFAILGYPTIVEIEGGKCIKNIAGKTQILVALK